MPASEYPALQGMPAGCTETAPWGISAVPVSVPYHHVDEAVIMQAPLVNIDWPAARHDMFTGEAAFDADVPGASIGYDIEEEYKAWGPWMQLSGATRDMDAQYHPDARDAIVAMAGHARALLEEIPDIYAKYEPGGGIVYPGKPYGNRPAGVMVFPLSRPESEIAPLIDLSQAGIWDSERRNDRQRIRDNFHEALHYLWCALYGKNQSESWKRNRAIYLESLPEPGGPQLTQEGPSAPPPVFPPLFPPPTTEPPTPGGAQLTQEGPEPIPPPTPPDNGEEPGFPGEDEFPAEPPAPAPAKKKRGSGAAIALAVGLVVVVAMAKK